MKPHISVIGLGLMGTALAGALLKASYPTTVWNRSPQRADGLVAGGALRAATVTDAISAGTIVIVCVLDYRAVREILDPTGDALAGRTLVNLTSGTPEQAREMAAWAAERGVAYLDGKIMAVPPMIGEPEALLLYSGLQDAFAAGQPTLRSLGNAAYFGADPGLASLYDIALLGLMYATMTGFLHAAALVGAEQISATSFLPYATEWLTSVTGFLPGLARQVDDGHYEGREATLDMQYAGMNHFVHASEARGIDAALPHYVRTLMERAIAAGHGADDFASVIEVIKRPPAQPTAR